MTLAARLRVFSLESWYEFLKVWRTPGYTVPALTFPLGFYLLFGVMLSRSGRGAGMIGMATYLVATYGACGVMGAAFHSFGVNVALERGQGWLELKRASPMPPAAYVVAKVAMVIGFGAVVAVGLAVIASLFGHVHVPPLAWVRLAVVLGLGVLPFAAFGLLLGVLCSANAIGPVTNLAFMAGSFASGLWIPLEALPQWWQRAAAVLPPYHYGRLALAAVGVESPWPLAVHVSVLIGSTLLALLAAWVAFSRDAQRA